MKTLFAAAASVALLATPALAQDWIVDAEASSVEARMTVFNAPTTASFDQFEATITLDPDALGTASIEAIVYATSGVVRNADGRQISDYQNAMDGTSGLDVANFELVRFVSSSVTATDTGYDAAGRLTIRDFTRDVILSFTLDIDGDRAVANGGFTLSREDLGMTNSSWGNNVSDAVELVIAIEADRG